MSQRKNEFVVKITEEESLRVERAYYETKSYEGLLSILSRSLNEGNPDAKELIKYYSDLYLSVKMESEMVHNMVMDKYLEPSFDPIHYLFDFEKCEVHCWYE